MPSLFDDDWEKNLKEREDHNKKKEESTSIAMDKFGMADTSSKKNKSDKINGRANKKNLWGRIVENVIPQSEDEPMEKFRKIFLMAAVVCLIAALIYLGWQIVQLAQGRETNIKIGQLGGVQVDYTSDYSEPDYIVDPNLGAATGPGTQEPEIIDLTPVVNVKEYPNFDNLKQQNADTRAWIKIQGTAVNNVVVAGSDFNYYLEHDFYGNESISGTIFSSPYNTWDGTDENTILFGHNMKSGDFFAYVVHYVPNDYSSEPIAFYKKHPTVMLTTPDGGCEVYKIFAGMLLNTEEQYGEVFHYVDKTHFSGQDDFNQFILDVMDRSWFFTDVDLTYGDKLLTLSTCNWPLGRNIETRWVVLARKVRPGESEEVDTTTAYRNYNPKLFDYYYKQISSSWGGRVWDTSKLLSY